MGSRFGHDFTKLRVHTNTKAMERCQALHSTGNAGMGRAVHGDPGLIRAKLEASAEGVTPLTPTLRHQLDAQSGGGWPLDLGLRPEMEAPFGADLSGVRLHTDTAAARLAGQLDAVAFTRGRDVFFGASAYDPASARGRAVLAHELTHVVEGRTGVGVQRQAAPPAVVAGGPVFKHTGMLASGPKDICQSDIAQNAPDGSNRPAQAFRQHNIRTLVQETSLDKRSDSTFAFDFSYWTDGVNLWDAFVALSNTANPTGHKANFTWKATQGAAPSTIQGIREASGNLATAIAFELKMDFGGTTRLSDAVTFLPTTVIKAYKEFPEVTGQVYWRPPW
jgi:hypothetical protein